MNFEKVVFAFCIILALSLNFGFVLGEIDNPSHHHIYELYAALAVSFICVIMRFGDRTQFGSTVLATSLVAVIQLIAAAVVWGAASHSASAELSAETMASITSLSAGALVANFISVVLLIVETSQLRR